MRSEFRSGLSSVRKEEQQRLLTILNEGIETGATADAGGIVRCPISDYTCPTLLAEEQRVFFRDTPLLMGLSTDLPENDSYWSDTETGLPILMVRDDTGTFHAFANTCRHRGTQVVADGRGTGNRFSCPFHAWTYSNKGDLIAVNKESSFGHVEKKEHGLVELPSAEKYGMLWVRPTRGDPIDVDQCLGGLADDMDHWNLPSHGYTGSQVLRADINWKLAIDTFGENYHFDVLHRETLSKEIRGNLQTNDIFDLNYRMVFAYHRFKEIVANVPDQSNWPFRSMTLSVYFIYPNAILLMDPYSVDVLRMFPDNDQPGKSRTAQSFYIVPEAEEHFQDGGEACAQRFAGFNQVVMEEDYLVGESTQRGALSGANTHLVFGRNEPALHHYHNAHRRGLGKPLLEVETA